MMNRVNRMFILMISVVLCLSFPELTFGQGQIKRQNQISKPNDRSVRQTNDIVELSRKFNWDSYGICQDTIVDLGLSVKWAAWNIGAHSPEQEGTLFGWGDPTGKETSIYSSKYPVKDPPMSICGDRRYDMAMANWGWPWRLPSQKELEELSKNCKWESFRYKNVSGVKLTGPNGNTLFIPVTSRRTANWNKDTQSYGSQLIIKPADMRGRYYSGELNSNGGQWEPWDCRPYILYFSLEDVNPCGYVDGTGLRSSGLPVRAVYAR